MEKLIAKDKTPLGANYNKETKTVDFKLYSKNAKKVILCIFDSPLDEEAIMNLEMKKGENDIWETSIKDYILNCMQNPVFYGFRVFGENWEYDKNFEPGKETGLKAKIDLKGNRFNPNKLAYDPYAKELSHLPSKVNPGFNMFRSGANFHLINNAKFAPKSVYRRLEDKEIAKVTPRAFNSEIIGEVHVKDLTQNLSIPEKGTFKGAAKFAQSIKKLGITMVEFLPVNEFDTKQNGVNHWGYMPLGYFTLARRYAFDKTLGNILQEFREMVDEFHKNEIKVCLDMVYNHTGEAGLINHNVEDAQQFSYSLIDNSSYYKVYENGYYRSNSGCGNDFNANNEGALNLIIDSLIFWINQGVDAFRFDLAAALLENSCNCSEIYDNIDSLAGKLKTKLQKKGIKVVDDFASAQEGVVLIAEPWTCGGSQCYHLGNFPSFWAEWNDVSRDTFRKITARPKEINPLQIKNLIEGSPNIFENPSKSINYIASHDGFTLFDLNHFDFKNSSTQGGSSHEISSSYQNNLEMSENAIRKQLALLFLSYGTPMIQIGDIIMHTKNGNNNSYNKDDGTNFLNWQKAVNKNTFENRIMEYIRNLINFRNENKIYLNKNFKNYLTYHYDNGELAQSSNLGYWNNNNDDFFGVLINPEIDDSKNSTANQREIYIASSKSDYKITSTLPKIQDGKNWYKILDTSDFSDVTLDKKVKIDKNYILNPQALVVFVAE